MISFVIVILLFLLFSMSASAQTNCISTASFDALQFNSTDISQCLFCISRKYQLFGYDSLCFKCPNQPVSPPIPPLILGNDGGPGNKGLVGASGGGGAIEVGGVSLTLDGANGGQGYTCNITGVDDVYGSGGGGGGRSSVNGLGGINAGNGSLNGSDGLSNRGGGGGGGEGSLNGIIGKGGKGGSGIVVVRYRRNSNLNLIIATGGDQIYSFAEWQVHIFTTTGIEHRFNLTTPSLCDILVVAGGGGGEDAPGGANPGGGGGGGQVIHYQQIMMAAGIYPVVVGSGGDDATNGIDSYFGDYRAIGGGKGFYMSRGTGNGGSGGGAGRNWFVLGLSIPSSSICNSMPIAVCQPGHLIDRLKSTCSRCPIGMEPDSSASKCITCPPGKYRPFNENGICTNNCPTNLWSIKEMYVLGNDGGGSPTNMTGSGGGGGAGNPGTNGVYGILYNVPGTLISGGNGGDAYFTTITGSSNSYGAGGAGAGDDVGNYKNGVPGSRAGYANNIGASTSGSGGGGTSVGSTEILGGAGGSGIVVIRYPIFPSEGTVGTGGSPVSTINQWRIHNYRSVGTFTFILNSARPCDILIVGGGGSGGTSMNNTTPTPGGAGGGGQVIHLIEYYLQPGTYTVTVGAGGVRSNGGNSSFDNIVAIGGGMGGGKGGLNGRDGGSGGGSGRNGQPGVALPPPADILPGAVLRKILGGWAIHSFSRPDFWRNKYDMCVDCPAGFQCNATHIVSCATGFYQNSSNPQICTQCPRNSIGNVDIRTCKCPLGLLFDRNLNQCFICQAGFEQDAAGTGCAACPAGAYRLANSTTGCFPCPSNAICTATSITCLAGYEWNQTNATCDLCKGGFFKNTTGLDACRSCPIGTDSTGTAGLGCQPCPLGKFRPVQQSPDFANGCGDCPELATCTATNMTCTSGATLSQTELFKCSQCSPLHFKSSPGNQPCDHCAVDLYSSDDYQSCVACPEGEYLSVAANCTKCPAGTEPNYNRTLCNQCSNGFYKSLSMTKCVNCPLKATCTSTEYRCTPGHFPNSKGTSCLQCPAGYIKPDIGNSGCTIQCGVGTQSNLERTECVKCPNNMYRNQLEDPYCRECPIVGVSSCQPTGFQCKSGWIERDKSCFKQNQFSNDEYDTEIILITTTLNSQLTRVTPNGYMDSVWYQSLIFYIASSVVVSVAIFTVTCSILLYRRYKIMNETQLDGYKFPHQRKGNNSSSIKTGNTSMTDIISQKEDTSTLEYAEDVF